MIQKSLWRAVALSAALGVFAPGVAYAQLLGIDLGDTLDSVGDTVGGVVGGVGDTVGNTVDAVGNTVGDTVDGLVGSGSPNEDPLGQFAPLDQADVIDAVGSNRALPLEQILAIARLTIDGEIIDARLIQVRGFLLYELKVVETDGDVADIYFYARSGQRVETN